ncbi:MAG TPA: vitamin B12-dependent ribonucleotide reductase, partial [Vicinamibacterales bacterium]|nr:vitamin B12-dependent ribonucleotide reductase [Vicinamibacterales bacterium]
MQKGAAGSSNTSPETTSSQITRPAAPVSAPGLEYDRFFSKEGLDPFDEIEWDLRSAVIGNEKGSVVFEQRDVEIPKFWTQQATNIVVSKYFRGTIGTPERERSVKQLIGRVVDTITEWARAQKYFASEDDLSAFSDDLKHLLVYQKAAFNSPVWFNVGFEKHPQCSACFINAVQDTMESILGLAKTEGMLFKYGSGTGSNLSNIRSSMELLAGGGTASGPVSFMKGFDAFAGVIKSGGKTRRAAKMVILNAEHPDIVEFINCKVEEEKKAWALIDAGYDGSFTGPAYSSVFFQNSNNSVRVSDEFMRAVADDGEWTTRAVRDGQPVQTYKARDLMRQIAEATWICGDPGMQYDTTVNDWHTCPNTARINASNPCSEYMFLDDSACNLSSINLMKFIKRTEAGAGRPEEEEFDAVSFEAACRTMITAMEVLVDNSSYPTPAITRNSHDYRPLGLGYANLGALLMSRGLPYDSDAGRDYAGAITALMHGAANAQSSKIARDHGGPFAGYAANREPMLRVMKKHRAALKDIDKSHVPNDLMDAAKNIWNEVLELGEQHGFRNAQATVLAPTGTIGFMMDCDTTGVEPDIALVKYKKLVGGGLMKIVNQTVPMALQKLGYTQQMIKEIIEYIDENETIEGAPHIKDAHLPVFDCAFKPARGVRSIHYMGHVRMMGATQPFLSGAISKTVNVPKDATVEDIQQAYIDSWRIGAKAVSIYRDGSKRTQPLNTAKDKEKVAAVAAAAAGPIRRKLPDERHAITHKFDISGHEGYITVGLFEDGTPGELFLVMAKEGSTISGFADAFAQAISYALQYGVPLQDLVDKFSHVRFEPSGMTKNPDVRFAKSIVDYIFRWMASKFLSQDAQYRAGVNVREDVVTTPEQLPLDVAAAAGASPTAAITSPRTSSFAAMQNQEDAP